MNIKNNCPEDVFEKKLDQFIRDFYQSEEYVKFKKADQMLYESKAIQNFCNRKTKLQSDIELFTAGKGNLSKDDLKEINEKISKLKLTISDEKCVKDYEAAYESIKSVRDVFNRELLRKLYL